MENDEKAIYYLKKAEKIAEEGNFEEGKMQVYFELGIGRRFDSDKEYVLYDCTCELINNALKHSGASRIDIHLNIGFCLM
jgi:signal transduction histidine kinase